MFHDPALGAALAFGHYGGALAVGLLFRFHGRGEGLPRRPAPGIDPVDGAGASAVAARARPLALRAVDAALRARRADGRPLMRVLNDAIAESARTLLVIASFIVLFAVVLRLLEASHALRLLTVPMAAALGVFGLPATLAHAAVAGLFEIDLGCAAAAAAHAPLAARLALAGAIIAWSGLSVHAQVLSVLAGTDIRIGPYYMARAAHSVIAGALTIAALGPARPLAAALGGVVPGAAAASVAAAAGVASSRGGGATAFWAAAAYGGLWAALAAGVPVAAVVAYVGGRGLWRVRLWAFRTGSGRRPAR
jgi:hypothetical protein